MDKSPGRIVSARGTCWGGRWLGYIRPRVPLRAPPGTTGPLGGEGHILQFHLLVRPVRAVRPRDTDALLGDALSVFLVAAPRVLFSEYGS